MNDLEIASVIMALRLISTDMKFIKNKVDSDLTDFIQMRIEYLDSQIEYLNRQMEAPTEYKGI